MNLKNILCLGLAASLSACCCTKHHPCKSEAKIPQPQAEATALAQVPGGTIKEAELEKEKGKLIWSFDIAKPGTPNITEVAIDAMTGAVVSTEVETPEDQAKEAKEHEKKHKKSEKDDDDKK
jgi:hypothetical protein